MTRILTIATAICGVSTALHTLYDFPVSNHGARVRLLIHAKRINNQVSVVSPAAIGGSKSTEFLRLNMQGKVPLLVTDDGVAIPESDTICRFFVEKYNEHPPTFLPNDLYSKCLSESIVRAHDIYISPIQGCMYRAPGSIFSTFGTDRKAAINELFRQLKGIDMMVAAHRKRGGEGPFLCGKELSLADATLFPTMVFCDFMLPQFFSVDRSAYMGAHLAEWWDHINKQPCAVEVKMEMTPALLDWVKSGRFAPIVAENTSV